MNDPFLSRLSTNHKSRLNIKTIKSVKAQKTLLKSEETICWLYTIYTMEDVSLFRCGDCQHRRFLLKKSLAPQFYYNLHLYGGDPSLAGDWIVLIVGCSASCAQYPVPAQYSTGLQESHKTNELALPIHHLYSPPSYTLSSHRGWILWTSSADPGSRVATADNLDIDVYLGGMLAVAPVSCSKHAPRLASFKSLLKPH